MMFGELYEKVGPDVELIAELLGIKPHEADRLINEAMDRRHDKRMECRRQANVRRPA